VRAVGVQKLLEEIKTNSYNRGYAVRVMEMTEAEIEAHFKPDARAALDAKQPWDTAKIVDDLFDLADSRAEGAIEKHKAHMKKYYWVIDGMHRSADSHARPFAGLESC
jgi:hypothetical protein